MTKDNQAKLDDIRGLLNLINERQTVMKEEDLSKIDSRLKALNGTVARTAEHVAINDTTLYGKMGDAGLVVLSQENERRSISNGASLKIIIWIMGIEFAMLATIIGMLVYLV